MYNRELFNLKRKAVVYIKEMGSTGYRSHRKKIDPLLNQWSINLINDKMFALPMMKRLKNQVPVRFDIHQKWTEKSLAPLVFQQYTPTGILQNHQQFLLYKRQHLFTIRHQFLFSFSTLLWRWFLTSHIVGCILFDTLIILE